MLLILFRPCFMANASPLQSSARSRSACAQLSLLLTHATPAGGSAEGISKVRSCSLNAVEQAPDAMAHSVIDKWLAICSHTDSGTQSICFAADIL
ncbi:hypothetical protein COCSUDRAFT_33622 [Coccomyxa subellipsoidea C-169]|uniref:Uncharacterized protein n=1 Tax=Coccomyxa subellipsoidea (strain C-169) TaxID=574566 RepID=I0YUG4_COCSC|nr:hypothetical protein COCSUDRAFT_33622 [Coccomyxa subellipsoidea C-169]EIE22033.1 hypothetical protein COCSUDRAFT_33622 [Coccomyxa subellipsoidea C-169]|eukprot:XP_005646577.1 hypothetical protein COCSUDRAFT_33622 [Coccomyxa subellipsoidea C-169]